jgi:hypothetical protein
VPAPVGRMVGHARTVEAATVPPHEIGPHPTFIEKDEPRGIEMGGRGMPGGPRQRDVSAIVFGRAYGFF